MAETADTLDLVEVRKIAKLAGLKLADEDVARMRPSSRPFWAMWPS